MYTNNVDQALQLVSATLGLVPCTSYTDTTSLVSLDIQCIELLADYLLQEFLCLGFLFEQWDSEWITCRRKYMTLKIENVGDKFNWNLRTQQKKFTENNNPVHTGTGAYLLS